MHYPSLEIRLRMNLQLIVIMKIQKLSRVGLASAASLCLLLAVGCGNKDDAPTAGAAPVRGEPIKAAAVRGEPIQQPAAETTLTPKDTEVARTAAAKSPTAPGNTALPAEKTPAPEKKVEAKAAPAPIDAETAMKATQAERVALNNKIITDGLEKKMDQLTTAVKSAAAVTSKKSEVLIAATKPTVTVNAGDTVVVSTSKDTVESGEKTVERVIVASKPTVSSKPGEAVAETVATALPAAAATLTPNPALDKEPEIVKSDGQDYLTISFERLASFEYEMPDEFAEVSDAGDGEAAKAEETKAKKKPEEKDQIPATVRKFNNKRIALEGFMLPLKVEDSLVTEMLIMRDQSMCCFGSVPKINEWVSIRMTGKGVKPVMDEPVTIYGKLKVGEIRENGYLVGIYEMDGERMGSRIDL